MDITSVEGVTGLLEVSKPFHPGGRTLEDATNSAAGENKIS